MTHKILQAGRLAPALETRLSQAFDTTLLWQQADPADFVKTHGAEFDIVVTNASAGASAALMDSLPGLKAICSFGVGYDTIDLPAARARGVVVSNTPDVLNDCVADLAMGLLIDAARGLSAHDRFVRRGDWRHGQAGLNTRVSGKRLGLLGLGRIGQAIARRAAGFDMDVRYHTRNVVAASTLVHEPSLLQLAGWADFLVVACAGGPSTRGLVSREVIGALRPEAFLVNVARGSVIDEPALVEALQQGRIAGAGLDVFADEPVVPDALLGLDNVVLLPHVASGTRETRQAMADLVFENVSRFAADGQLVTPIAAGR